MDEHFFNHLLEECRVYRSDHLLHSLAIAEALGEPSAAVQAALSRLASAGKLTRSGGPRGYVYGKCMTRDDVIAKLRELRNSGVSREAARATLTAYGIEFENSLWTQAGGEL